MTIDQAGRQAAAITGLTSALWRLRELHEHLRFKSAVLRLVLEGGETHWLDSAIYEREAILHELHQTDVLRAVASVDVAERLGIDPDATLAELADAVPEPWDGLLREHLADLRRLMTDTEDADGRQTPILPSLATFLESATR